MEREVMSPPFEFTAEEWSWYQSLVPDVPEEVVAELIHAFDCADQEDDLRQEAYVGTANGVKSFDATKGELRPWAFFSALHAGQAILRRKKRHRRLLKRMWDAVTVRCQHEHRTFGVMGETEETYRSMLTEFRSAVAAAACVGLAVLEVPSGGQDELVERATAARCAEALKEALGNLSERRLELLRMCFADDQSVKEAAAARGKRGYRAELLEFHRAVELVGARMRGMGFHELPPFPAEAEGTILRESSGRSVKP
jgi:DNA-directed RNA polymerase specialized sigma24 family protein